MSWTCPECGREFRNTRQWHSCIKLDPEAHFRNRNPQIRRLFGELETLARNFGPYELSPVKTAIQFRHGVTFLSVVVKPDHLKLEIQLPYKAEGIHIEREVMVSANRWFYILVIDDPADLKGVVSTWLNDAYNMVVGSKDQ